MQHLEEQKTIDAGSQMLAGTRALAMEQRRAAEELVAHARTLEEQIEAEIERTRAHEAAQNPVPDVPDLIRLIADLEAARDGARRDLEQMERHLADARRAFARFDEGFHIVTELRMLVSGMAARQERVAEAQPRVLTDADARIAARRAADAARRAAAASERA